MRRIGENVRFYRILRGLKQAAFARLVQVAPAYISQIETNQRLPSLKVTRRIAEVLGLEMSELLRESESAVRGGRLTRAEMLDLLRTLTRSIESDPGEPREETSVVRGPAAECTELASEPAFCIVLRSFFERAVFGRELADATLECHVVLEGRVHGIREGAAREYGAGEAVASGETGRVVAEAGTRVLSIYGPRVELSVLAGVARESDAFEP